MFAYQNNFARRAAHPARAARVVQKDAAQAPLVDALIAVQAQLGPRDAEFAGSLISNFNRYGRLSDKQMPWVVTLTERVTKPVAQPAPVDVAVDAIVTLFAGAARNMRRVKVKLAAPSGQPVVFQLAGTNSKYAGQILVTDGGPFGSNVYFGRIDTAGRFNGTRRVTEEVLELIKEFAADPAGTAGRYGRLTGGCSFCNHPLRDGRSVEVGYGPICAGKFNLPWGA